jgi:DNA (cytosine-5)-methyltransferase 1
MQIPVIDLFAGPGGLGEGFSSFEDAQGNNTFRIKLSIEKDSYAHCTLKLRAFYRQFTDEPAPEEYYEHLAGLLTQDQLFEKFPDEAKNASNEAWKAELGNENFPNDVVDQHITKALSAKDDWVLIGGPPCQAYSLVGRSRRKNDPGFADDEKHTLYKQYLRILAFHQPPVFVMENVKGILSAKHENKGVLHKILTDLENPAAAAQGTVGEPLKRPLKYRLFSLVTNNRNASGGFDPQDFVVCAEKYGIPQARHRVILLGIRADKARVPGLLTEQTPVKIEDVIADLPRLRSGLSQEADSGTAWRQALLDIPKSVWFRSAKLDESVRTEIRRLISEISATLERGDEYMLPTKRKVKQHDKWFTDPFLGAVCNHSTRAHIRMDLHRYFFVATFGRVNGRSPLLNDFPSELLPEHKNVAEALKETKFNDRFRVQVQGRPSTTVTSHISKDGHYFIHYDPTQCRSLTVREAARLQTFPDNYFFEGPRTQQYQQVGNAVPPLLAKEIAEVVHELFN